MQGGICSGQEKEVILETAQANMKKTCTICKGSIHENGSLTLIIQLIWIIKIWYLTYNPFLPSIQ